MRDLMFGRWNWIKIAVKIRQITKLLIQRHSGNQINIHCLNGWNRRIFKLMQRWRIWESLFMFFLSTIKVNTVAKELSDEYIIKEDTVCSLTSCAFQRHTGTGRTYSLLLLFWNSCFSCLEYGFTPFHHKAFRIYR